MKLKTRYYFIKIKLLFAVFSVIDELLALMSDVTAEGKLAFGRTSIPALS